MADTREFCKFNCTQLRQELARRGAKTTGRKAELLQRLEDYDRNQDFRGTPMIMPEEIIVDWPITGFTQLTINHIKNNELPPISRPHIDGYFMHRMGLDRRSVGDAQALNKGQLLLDSNRVEACSFLNENGYSYLSGICGAAMKKMLSYSLKVKMDRYGDIINSHCECPSGTGPHGTCKHVAALLLVIVDVVEKKSMNGLNESCTDVLQTFHKPKKRYGGSPVKAEDLPGCMKGDLSDTRPVHLRQRANRQERMRSLVINFAAKTGRDITARYLFPRANLSVAAKDHDYLDKPFTEYRVLKRLQLSHDEAGAIEKATVKQSKSTQWYEEREWRLTASRFGEICHLTERRNIQKLCKSLLENHEIHSPAITHGRIHEALAIKEFEKVSGEKVTPCGLFVDPEFPFLAATPDGIIDHQRIIEVKCPYGGRLLDIQVRKEFPFLEEKDGKLGLKRTHNYFDQVQGQLMITQRRLCHFIVYTKKAILVIDIPYEEEYCKHSLLPKLRSFFDTHYLKFIANTL